MNIRQTKFTHYNKYVKLQTAKALKSTKKTINKKNSTKTTAKILRQLFPELKTVLCVGCRHESEINAFKEEGFDAVGIDIIKQNNIITCDMSKITEHIFFKDKKIDIMFCSHSLEHCLDFNGFLKGVDYLGIKVIQVECPQRNTTNSWDCTFYDFMKKTKKVEKNDILKYFTDFDLISSTVIKNEKKEYDSTVFTLKRK